MPGKVGYSGHHGLLPTLLVCLALISAITTATPLPSSSQQTPGVVGHRHTSSRRLFARNLGSAFKDRYLMWATRNYLCTKEGRVIPVDPESGKIRVGGLRKRGFADTLFHTEPGQHDHGSCKNPTWIWLKGWSGPIPMTQAVAQYPQLFGVQDPAGDAAVAAAASGNAAQQGAGGAPASSSQAVSFHQADPNMFAPGAGQISGSASYAPGQAPYQAINGYASS
ncbi:uncharacterized protein PSFLO_00314 [Pseudozyma flocculosa]|uniref:Uncharacterized protein n=2 Tax=Pseudozyma flocculosa TaxID=84751 RepID=A0A5C3ER97_9BASI|nr:uncharacterized protein PSFLO_00314 [Pseudozyma flocculosa]